MEARLHYVIPLTLILVALLYLSMRGDGTRKAASFGLSLQYPQTHEHRNAGEHAKLMTSKPPMVKNVGLIDCDSQLTASASFSWRRAGVLRSTGILVPTLFASMPTLPVAVHDRF